MVEFITTHGLAAINTFVPEGGPTYFAACGTNSTIDYLLVPISLAPQQTGTRVWLRVGRKSQMITAKARRDHYPVCSVTPNACRCHAHVHSEHRLDYDKLAEAFDQGGSARDKFFEVLHGLTTQHYSTLQTLLSYPTPDDLWEFWMFLVQQAAVAAFAAGPCAAVVQHRTRIKYLHTLLRERAKLRSCLIKPTIKSIKSIFWHLQ